jgi:hypothetical protein
MFHAIEGENLQATSRSWLNPKEAEQVIEYFHLLLNETRLKSESVIRTGMRDNRNSHGIG